MPVCVRERETEKGEKVSVSVYARERWGVECVDEVHMCDITHFLARGA